MTGATKLLVVMGVFVASTALAQESGEHIGDEGITLHIESVPTPAEVISAWESARTSPSWSPDRLNIDWATITNVGKQAWQVIVDNAPVANIEQDFATGLPLGIASASELENFSDLEFTSWRLSGNNLFGTSVYDVTYTIVHQYGGSYQGKGKYLATVAVVPSQVNVLWGYKLNMKVATISSVNVGSVEAPVASVTLQMICEVRTPMKVTALRKLFQFRGDSAQVLETGI